MCVERNPHTGVCDHDEKLKGEASVVARESKMREKAVKARGDAGKMEKERCHRPRRGSWL